MPRKKKADKADEPKVKREPSSDLPIAEIPIEDNPESDDDPEQVKELPKLSVDAALDFPKAESFSNTRGGTVLEVARKCLKAIQADIEEELFISPDNSTIQYTFENEPADVRYIVAASLQKAGFAVSYDGEQTITVILPHVKSIVSGTLNEHISKVEPL